jgi:PAS domain S-box-containing protein
MAPPSNASRTPTSSFGHRYRGYLIGLVTMAALVVTRRYFLDAYFHSQLPLRLFILPVIAAAWSGGLWPGLFITFVSIITAFSVFGELTFESIDWQLTLLFTTVGTVVSVFMESLHATRRRLEDRQQQLEHEMAERQRVETSDREHRQRLAQEIGQRALAEMGLREREERIRMAVESANIGTWDLNVLTGERSWSDRSKTMFGLPADEDVTKVPFIDLIHPDDQERVAEARQRALDPNSDGSYEVEYRARWRDGTIRWILGKGQAFFQGEGASRHAVRFIGTVFDFTERKELEHTLQEADRRKDEFLATLAHELRNPLAPISYALQLWPNVEHDAAESARLRSMMARQVEHITRLIDDLMDVSRITQGKIELRKQQTDIDTILKGAIESVQSFVESCGHQLTLQAPHEPILINGDVARLTQVFANILNNAAKYTVRDGAINVSARRENDHVSVSIRDNGPGIPEQMLGEIFDLFRQVDDTVSRSHGGLGIGLTLVKQLVELHGGKVAAFSEGPGKGSEFVVTLPAMPAVVSAGADLDSQLPRLQPLPAHRILVVDDVDASADTLAMMLRAMGQDVVALNDGQAALDWIASNKPDVVFLDVAMPAMSGYEVARRLREDANSTSMTLIALTGYGQEEDRRRAFEAGFDHHIVKPANIDALEKVLRSVPSRKESERVSLTNA